MKKLTKKLLIIFSIIVSVLIVGYAIYIVEFLITTEVGMYYSFDNNILNENLDAYTRVAQLIYDDFQECECSSHGYSLTNNEEIYEEYKATCERSWKIILINNEEYELYRTVINSFRVAKKGLEFIKVEDNFVVFCIVNGVASLVYSIDGTPPNFVDASDEQGRAIVKKVTDNWFYPHRR